MGDACNYCGGQGTVVDHGQTQTGWQKSAGGGTLTCPRCYGTGVNGGTDDAGSAGGGFDGVSGTAYFVFILIFVGFCVGGVNELIDYFDIQFANDEYILYGAAAVSFIVGILIRNILAMIAGVLAIGVMLFVIGAVVNGIIQFQANDKENNNEPVTYVAPGVEDAVALSKKIMAEENANLEAARRKQKQPLSAEESAEEVAIGEAHLQKQLAIYNLPEDMQSRCVVCKDYMETGTRWDTPKNSFLAVHCAMQRGNCAGNGVRY